MKASLAHCESNRDIRRSFWRYALPSVAAMLVSGLYQIIDGIFIGHYSGYEGLAAMNMAWPIIIIIPALGLMIGMGSGSLMSMRRGAGDNSLAPSILSNALYLSLALGLLSALLVYHFGADLLAAQGARDTPLALALDYSQLLAQGAIITIFAAALPILIRNDESPYIATALMVLAALSNIVLDYLFIAQWGWGIKGAAIATLLAQLTICIGGIAYFFSISTQLNIKKMTCLVDAKLTGKIVVLGSSCLTMYIYSSFVLAIHNKLFMDYGSPLTVAAFAVASYLMTMYYLLAEGLGEGMQPPLSYFFGQQSPEKIKAVFLLATKVTLLLGIAWVSLLNLFPQPMIKLFHQESSELLAQAANGIQLHLFTIFLDGFIVIATVYFMAIGQGVNALAISVANMLIQMPFLYFLPQWLGVDGVWLALPLSTLSLFLIVAPLVWLDINRRCQHGLKTVANFSLVAVTK